MFIGGLDLGQSGDPTAMSVNEVVGSPSVHMVRDLFRWPLGTAYTDIVDDVHTFWKDMGLGDSLLCIDYTGCGRPIVDLFLRRAEIPVRAICITSGSVSTETEYGWNVPKRDLAVVMAILMRLRRFQVAEGIGEEAAMLMKELQNFRVEITKAGNETYECLVGDTKVTTDRGDVCIKDIVAGDRVLTRKGYRRVMWSGVTKRVNNLTRIQLDSGENLVGTGDHQVWTRNRGWLELRCVGQHDELLSQAGESCQQRDPTPRLSSSTGSHSAKAGRRSISSVFSGGSTYSSIGRCGSSTTAPFPATTTSTTRTATGRTTTSPTWSVSPSSSTARPTSQGEFGPASFAELCLLASLARAITARSLAAPAASGTSPCLALAAANLLLRSMPPQCSALQSAARPIATPIAERLGNASGAGLSSSRSTRFPNSVRAVAPPVIVSSSNAVPVYDLMVEDQHEFFANGVLVHNSWRSGQHDDLVLAAAMACWYAERGCLGAFDAGGGSGVSSRSLTADLDDFKGHDGKDSASVLDRSF